MAKKSWSPFSLDPLFKESACPIFLMMTLFIMLPIHNWFTHAIDLSFFHWMAFPHSENITTTTGLSLGTNGGMA